MKKLSIVLLLTLVLLLGAIPAASALAEEVAYSVVGGNIYFDTDTGEITRCDDSVTTADIPSSINGVYVTSIGDSAFEDCDSLTSVTIPDSVTSIGSWAFCDCDSLTSVTIPDSVTSIGDRSFRYCSSLTSVTIPDSVTSIGDSSFGDCDRLTEINVGSGNADYSSQDGVLFNKDKTELICCPGGKAGTYAIPDGVTGIGDYSFENCYSLTGVIIPDSVTSIGSWAFEDCDSLTSVTIPDSVTSIGDSSFRYCSSLTEINVGSGNANYSSQDGVLFNKDKTELICCPGGKAGTYAVPDGVTGIGDYAFRYCTNLTGVIIPDSVTSIGYYAFVNCHNLTSVTIPDSVTSIGEGAFEDCDSLTSVTIPDSVTSIGSWAFYDCDSLTSVTIPDSVTSIGDSSFRYCSSLTEINVGSGNANYSSQDGVLFNKDKTELICCPGGKAGTYAVPDGVTSIGYYAFYNCNSLTSVTIPDSVTSIGERAFAWCISLTDVYYGGTEEQWAAIDIEDVNNDLLDANIHFNYVENHLTVTVDDNSGNWQDGELHVAYGGTAELRVNVSADDMEGLVYRWVHMCEGGEIIDEQLGSVDAVQTISNVTKDGLYVCYVTDKYDTTLYAAICVRAGEEMSAHAAGDNRISVAPDGSVSLQVSVNAGDMDDISFAWWRRYYNEEDWEPLDDEEDTLEILNADQNAQYRCYVYQRLYYYDSVLSEGVIETGRRRVSVRFYVNIENNFSADVDYSTGDWELYVPAGDEATLKVAVTATDITDVSYTWFQRLFDEYGDEEYVLLDCTGDSYVIDAVNAHGEYYCEVRDRYGNEDGVWFYVYVDNNLSAKIDRTTGDWDGNTLYTSVGDHATLKVIVDAYDKEGITYKWTQKVRDEDGHWETIILNNTADTLIIDPVSASGNYCCEVSDKYGNEENAWFYIRVNNFSAWADLSSRTWEDLYVPLGDPATLRVIVNADDTSGVTYLWKRDGETLEETTEALVIESVTGAEDYYCVVSDQYGNYETIRFYVYVDNHLNARADESLGNWIDHRLYVPYGESATLNVIADADEGILTYSWEQSVFDKNGEWVETVDLPEDGSTYCVAAVTKYSIYYCTVEDQYGNSMLVRFEVIVDNGFMASIDDSQGVWVDGELYVACGDSATLSVDVSAFDMSGVTYKWKQAREVHTWGNEITLDCTGPTLTLDSVDRFSRYDCEISDGYGNRKKLSFYVNVMNSFYADVDRTTGSWDDYTLYVSPGESVTVRINVTADDTNGITYKWEQYISDEDGTRETVKLHNKTNELTIDKDDLTSSGYSCEVCDKYGNTSIVHFEVCVDVGFSAELDKSTGKWVDSYYDSYDLLVPYGEPAIVRINVTADDLSSVTYEWVQRIVYQDGRWHDVPLKSVVGNTLPIDAVTENSKYFCRIRAGYGNEKTLYFGVSVDNALTAEIDKSNGKWKYEYYYPEDPGFGGWDTLYVPYGESASIRINTTANNTDGLTYEWRKGDSGWTPNGDSWMTDANGGVLTLSEITKNSDFGLYIRDSFGNEKYLHFVLTVDNNFSAEADKTVGRWEDGKLKVKAGDPVTMKVDATCDDGDLSYQWYYNSYLVVATDTDLIPVWGAEKTDLLTLANVLREITYVCKVADKYGSVKSVYFPVVVENGFNAEADKTTGGTWVEDELFVTAGNDAVLKVIVDAADKDRVRYQWYKKTTNSYGDTVATVMNSTGESIILANVTEKQEYSCRVIDKYDNEATVDFHVRVNNGFSAEADKTVGIWNGDEMLVQSGNLATLKVIANAVNAEGIKYRWYKVTNTGVNGLELLSGKDMTNDTFSVGPVTIDTTYICRVNDSYNNLAEIEFVLKTGMVFDDNGVQAVVPPGAVDGEIVFVAELLEGDAIPDSVPDGAVVYDLYFEKDDVRVQPSGAVTVSLPVPEGMTGSKCKVYYVDESDLLTDMHAAFSEGYMIFTATHFSYYAVVEESGYIPGDINGDGSVNNKDVTRLMRYIKYHDVDVEEAALDVNGDGAVNNKDVTRLMRYIKYKDVEIH